MTIKQRAAALSAQMIKLANEIDQKREQAENASMFNLKPIIEKMGKLQAEYNLAQSAFNSLVLGALNDE